MSVHYKFKSAKDYDSVAIDGHFISVGHLKENIFELKHLGRGTDFDLVVTNAQTNEEYLDEGMLIPKNTSVLIRRIPGRPRKPIITAPVTEQEEPNVETKTNSDDVQAVKCAGVDPSAMKYAEEFEWDEFGNDLYAIPETVPIHSSIPVQDIPVSKEEEESMIKALIDTPALDWQRQPSDGFGHGRGFGRGIGGRGFGRGGFEKKTPPQGYICYRCKVAGHFIQHCPTNGDPNFDVRRVKPPTGIPKSMLMATPDGSYALPSGAVAVLKPNESAFEKEIEGMPSTRSVSDFPPELHCPLCKQVMKDAVLTSKCCFTSFCDRCIRFHIISKSTCVCGATNILADDLLPNKTLRDTINRILESNNNSAENGGSAFQVQDMESHNPQAKIPSPTQSPASKGQHVPAPPAQRDETPRTAYTVEENKISNLPLLQEKERTIEVPDVLEATPVREAASRGTTPLADKEVQQQKPISGEAGAGKKKKKEKNRMPPGPGAAEMQWRTAQQDHLAPEYHMMPFGPSAPFNPYWNGVQPGFMPPYGGPMPYMGGYGINHPMDFAFGGLAHDPFGGPGGCMLPYGPPQPQPQRMGFHAGGPPIINRQKFEAQKADVKRKREMERREERQPSKDGEYGREGSNTTGYVSSRSKFKSEHHRPDRHSPDRRLSSKTKPDHELDHHRHHSCRQHHDETHKHHRDHSNSRQRRSESPRSEPVAASSSSRRATAGHHEEEHKLSSAITAPYIDHDSSSTDDDERHFKRRASKYKSPAAAEEGHRREHYRKKRR
ncbi:hypothetical protein CASFOL_020229 [Castilleja foliolosa]|uniref:Uncharacterized protein n=1 Tax=Castilleja foliolosa TaxID=1961234 RepID=A0ABD3D130_9LAMI